MDLETLTKLWPIVTALLTAYGAVAILFYRVTQLEKTFIEMAANDKHDHGTLAAKVDALNSNIQAFELRIAAQYTPKDDFNRTMARVEAKVDALNESIVKMLVNR